MKPSGEELLRIGEGDGLLLEIEEGGSPILESQGQELSRQGKGGLLACEALELGEEAPYLVGAQKGDIRISSLEIRVELGARARASFIKGDGFLRER